MDTANELAQHPGISLALITALFGLVVALGKIYLSSYEKANNEKLVSLSKHNVSQDTNLENLKTAFYRTEANINLKTEELKNIHAAVSEVSEEVKLLVKGVNEFQLANEKAHSGIINIQERLIARLEAVEKRMPNGELKRLTLAVEKLVEDKG